MRYKITTIDNRILDNAEERLQSLNDKIKRGKAALPDAWRRVMYVYRIEGYAEAIESLHSLCIHIKWYQIMYQYLKGYLETEIKDCYKMIWEHVEVSYQNSDTIYSIIRDKKRSYIDEITRTRQSLETFLSTNKIPWRRQPNKYWCNKIIAYCTLHKIDLTLNNTNKKDCFHRNSTCSCSNLVLISSPFYKTKAGQHLLAGTSISYRAQYRKI